MSLGPMGADWRFLTTHVRHMSRRGLIDVRWMTAGRSFPGGASGLRMSEKKEERVRTAESLEGGGERHAWRRARECKW